jgi:uracil-DNA glycosylase family 4
LRESFRQRALSEMGLGQGWVRRDPARVIDGRLVRSISVEVMLCGTLDLLEGLIGECVGCDRALGRTRPLPGQGNRKAALMVIDMVPTREEAGLSAALGGPAGRLFEQMLFAIGLKRSDIYLAHELRCDGSAPTRQQCDSCSVFLEKEIELVAPKVVMVIAPGGYQRLAKLQDGRLAHKVVEVPHPLALLADSSLKRRAWANLLEVRDALAANQSELDAV